MEKRFAALKIPDSVSDSKLTRAVSFSELPSTRRIIIQQSYRDGDSADLVRQYSCEQIFDPVNHTSQVKYLEVVRASNEEPVQTWKSAVPYSNSLETANWAIDHNDIVTTPSTSAANETEYMEVDDLDSANQSARGTSIAPTNANLEKPLSAESNEDFAKPIFDLRLKRNSRCTRENESVEQSENYRDMKGKIRPLVPKGPVRARAERSYNYFRLLFVTLLSVAVVLISILLYQDQPRESFNDFAHTVVELRKRIHGQSAAMEALGDYLLLDAPLLKVIVLVGGTGVGKSYTVEIIKESFATTHFVHQYFPPIGITISDISLSALYSNLIILENLKEDDVLDVINFFRTCREVNNLHIIVLAVFNIEQVDDELTRSVDLNRSLTIKDYFVAEDIAAKIIVYNPLSEDALEQCIVDAAKVSDLILSDKQIYLIKQNLLINNAGCKGAYSKVQVIGRQ